MEPQVQTDYPLNREFALNMILDAFPDTPLVTTTGFTSREVFELREQSLATLAVAGADIGGDSIGRIASTGGEGAVLL